MLRVVEAGVSLAPDALKKRVRLVNVLSIFGVSVLLGSVPFDWVTAPRWMIAEDLLGAAVFLTFPWMNARGWFTSTRVLCILVTDLIVLTNVALLGPESGSQMVFFALAAIPFALFDASEVRPLAMSVFAAIACFALAESGQLDGLRAVTEAFSPDTYYAYSAVMTVTILLFTLSQVSAANLRAERALFDSREHYRLVAESAGDAIITTDEQGTIVFASPAAGPMFDHPVSDLLGTALRTLVPSDTARPTSSVRSIGRRRDGSEFPIEISIGESRAGSRPIRTAVIRDISERVRAEADLEESRERALGSAKMAALGLMSGGIAHEVNNPLSAVLLHAQQLRHLATAGKLDAQATLATAEHIERTVARIRRIVDALRSFARQGDHDPLVPAGIARIVTEAVAISAPRCAAEHIEMIVEPIPPELLVACRESEVSQILLNLMNNACEAVDHQAERWIRIAVEVDSEEARVAVTDSGPGVPEDIRSRIMEPFFTTKPFGKGTGLGLSVSRGLAEAHGGHLALDVDAPHTRFVLTLRRTGAPTAGAAIA
jgi:PAS domain S-box-containing protein